MGVCWSVVRRLFRGDRFEVLRVMETADGKCVVDFRDRTFEPYFDAEFYCSALHPNDWEAYRRCVEECKTRLKLFSISSVKFNPKTLEVEEASIATHCYGLLSEPYEDEEETREERMWIQEKFRRAGCLLVPDDVDYVHPLDIIKSIAAGISEYPPICYIHPRHLNSKKCRIDKLLKVL